MIKQLRSWREDCTRDPFALRELWDKLEAIEAEVDYDEMWTVLEQFCLAAIDLHDEDMIDTCLSRLNKQFPDSNRVKILDTMANYERVGDYETANKKYNEILKQDDTHVGARKRKIAILVSQRRHRDAIKELCDYLRKFMNDTAAWNQLCELYCLEQDYAKAIFCMEELLLSNANDHIYHTRLAEIHYTNATGESLNLARAYYSKALRLNSNNTRAKLGLELVQQRLSNKDS